jgi:hypothetical protein
MNPSVKPTETMELHMAEHPGTRAASHMHAKRKDSLGYQLIFGATFLIFLAVAIADRLVPLRWLMGAAKTENYVAVFAEAKAAAMTYTPFAFMG